MSAHKQLGFTLIELMVAIAIIGLLATIIVPNLSRLTPGYERKQFITHLNGLMMYGKQNALVNHRLQQLLFNFDNNTIALLEETDQKDPKGEVQYKPVFTGSLANPLKFADSFEFKNFYIDGTDFDELASFAGRKTGEIFIYIVPEGMAQQAVINIIDKKDVLYSGEPRPFGLVLNPFTAQFKEYDTFQK